VAHHHRVAALQPACRREGLGRFKAEHLRLLRQPIDPELVTRVRADDGQLHLTRQRAGATGVVDVRMGQQDLRQRQLQGLGRGPDARQVATGVDDGGLQGLVAPDEAAVLLEGGDGDGLVAQHDGRFGFSRLCVERLNAESTLLLRSQKWH
jgi:hypothetical protein